MDTLHGMGVVIAFTKKPEPDLYICSGEDILVTDKESFRADKKRICELRKWKIDS